MSAQEQLSDGGTSTPQIPSSTKERQIENAASVAGMILTTESLITDVPDPTPAGAPAMPPMGYWANPQSSS